MNDPPRGGGMGLAGCRKPRRLRVDQGLRPQRESFSGGGFRPIAAAPPRNGEGDHRRWWGGTGGAALRIKDRKHLACPSTMLRMVPLPQRGRIGSFPPQKPPLADRSRLRFNPAPPPAAGAAPQAPRPECPSPAPAPRRRDRKSTRLNSSH